MSSDILTWWLMALIVMVPDGHPFFLSWKGFVWHVDPVPDGLDGHFGTPKYNGHPFFLSWEGFVWHVDPVPDGLDGHFGTPKFNGHSFLKGLVCLVVLTHMAESDWLMQSELFPYFCWQDGIILLRMVRFPLLHPNIQDNKMQSTPGPQLREERRGNKMHSCHDLLLRL